MIRYVWLWRLRRRRTSLHSRPNRSPKPIPGKGPEKVLRRRRPVARFRPKRRGFRSPRGLPFQRRRQETDMSRLSVEVRSLAFRTKWLVELVQHELDQAFCWSNNKAGFARCFRITSSTKSDSNHSPGSANRSPRRSQKFMPENLFGARRRD